MKTVLLCFAFVFPYCLFGQDDRSYGDENGILYLRGRCFTGSTQEFCALSGESCPKDDHNKTFLVLNTFITKSEYKKYKYAVYTQDAISKRWYRVTRITHEIIKIHGCITAISKKGDEVVIEQNGFTQRFKRLNVKEPFLPEWALIQRE